MADRFLPVEIKRLTQDDFQISVGQAKYSGTFDGIKILILENIVIAHQKLREEEKWKTLTSETDFSDLLVEQLKQNVFFVYAFIVNREAQEGLYTKRGYLDIKIDIAGSRKYFAFECKRLDDKTGRSSLQQAYIDEGLHRFIIGKYAKEEIFGGMIGFIVAGKISVIVQAMKKKVKNYHFLGKYELLDTLCDNCTTSFQSKHKRKNSLSNIHIYHLFLDFIR